VVGFARQRAITYFISAIEFFVAMQFADLVVAIALVLAFGLRVVASIGASGGEDGCDRDADEKYFCAHD
jgi:hypothetical protein